MVHKCIFFCHCITSLVKQDRQNHVSDSWHMLLVQTSDHKNSLLRKRHSHLFKVMEAAAQSNTDPYRFQPVLQKDYIYLYIKRPHSNISLRLKQ